MENESLSEVLRQLAELQKKIDDLTFRVSALESRKEDSRPRQWDRSIQMIKPILPGPRE